MSYKERILTAVPPGSKFTPLMTLYLTDDTPVQEVWQAQEAGVVAFKLYPAGNTMHPISYIYYCTNLVKTIIHTLHSIQDTF